MNDTTSPPPDLSRIRYCERHESHWIPWDGASERGASCPWCSRDLYWDELEDIYDSFLTASRQGEGFHVMEVNMYLERWKEILGKNVVRGK